MRIRGEQEFDLPIWWFILPAYLTLWSVVFSLYSYVDGNAMMQQFGIDTGGASDFIMLNSAGRYLAIALGMLIGIWMLRSYYSILTALLVRLSMDVLDLVIGIRTEVIQDLSGVAQSFLMFLLPGLLSLGLLIRFKKSRTG